MLMKNIFLAACLPALLFSCNNRKNIPDISGIKADIAIERFERSFFGMDTNHIPGALEQVRQQHPGFYPDFMQHILGVSGNPADSNTVLVTRAFLRGYADIYDTLQQVYAETGWLEKELEKAYRFVKYYFPSYQPGNAITFIGPFDAPGVASTRSGIAIGLQQYAGQHFSVYRSGPGQELFPLYISRRFSKEYITANCMKAVADDLFPDQSAGKSLVSQMIEKGKQWYLLDKFLPETPDSVKTGYTQNQLDWCTANEGLIWSYIIKTEDLHSLNPTVIQTYVGEAPFTQGFSQENSPGNIGPWIGWQIIRKFVSKNPDLSPADVMKTDPARILEEAKYKPK